MKSYDGTSVKYKEVAPITLDLLTYIDMIAQISGIDIDFQKYINMKPEERVQFLREQKIKKISDV